MDQLIQLQPLRPSPDAIAGLNGLKVDTLKELLQNENQLLREAASYALGEMGRSQRPPIPYLRTAIPKLTERMQKKDESPVVRSNSVYALSQIAQTQTKGAPPFDPIINIDPDVTLTIIELLKEPLPSADQSLPSTLVRSSAIDALGSMNVPPVQVILALTKAFNENHGKLALSAAEKLKKASLVNIETESMQTLLNRLDKQSAYCDELDVNLQILSDPNALQVLSNMLKTGDLDQGLEGIRFLALVNVASVPSKYDLLGNALSNPSEKVRLAASALLLDVLGSGNVTAREAVKTPKNEIEKTLSQISQNSNSQEYRDEANRLLRGDTSSYTYLKQPPACTAGNIGAWRAGRAFRNAWIRLWRW